MAYQISSLPMTLSDLRWETAHSFTYCKPFKCDFLYSCTAVDKVSLVMESRQTFPKNCKTQVSRHGMNQDI